MTTSPDGSLHKHIRVSPERSGSASNGPPRAAPILANQVLVELAMEALDRRQWPATETEMQASRSASLVRRPSHCAPASLRTGASSDVQEIRAFISTIVPDPDASGPPEGASTAGGPA